MRADETLVKLGISPSRSKARALIEEGKAFCKSGNSEFPIDKASRKIPDGASIRIAEGALTGKYVSRAGLKLEAFLDKFGIDLLGAKILDAGASTGGFTDCALSKGAKSSACVDVGKNQLHQKIASDPRVENYENTDVRNLYPKIFKGESFDFICADLSFISLEKILPHLWPLLKIGGKLVCLVKPQFESSPEIMRKNKGVLRDSALQLKALKKISDFAKSELKGCEEIGFMESPILGGDGNKEFLAGFKKIPV